MCAKLGHAKFSHLVQGEHFKIGGCMAGGRKNVCF